MQSFDDQVPLSLSSSSSAVVAELQVTPDVPIALVQLSTSPPAGSSASSTLLVVTYNQLYAVNKWSIVPGMAILHPQSI